MASPLVTFPDPLIVALGILRAGLPAVHPGEPVQVGTVRPETRPADAQGLPYVRVTIDGTNVRYPVSRTDFLRVVVWHTEADNSLRLAQECLAVLMAFPGDAVCRGFGEPIGPTPASDPDAGPLVNRVSGAGSPFAFLTVAVRLRPITL